MYLRYLYSGSVEGSLYSGRNEGSCIPEELMIPCIPEGFGVPLFRKGLLFLCILDVLTVPVSGRVEGSLYSGMI